MIPASTQTSFERFLVKEYLLYGSINKVLQVHKYNLPISFASYDRLLNRYQIVKSAGPNSKLSESLYLLKLFANYKVSLEKTYQRHAPTKIQVSTNTLHRILHYMRLRLTRRQGVALLISPQNTPNLVLLGNDISLVNTQLGQRGDYSLPMGHSKTGEPIQTSIIRVLQNEVFTNRVLNNNFPFHVVPKHPKPMFFIDIADIHVSVYKISLPKNVLDVSSFKLENLKFVNVKHLPKGNYRPGVKEIISYSTQEIAESTSLISELNEQIYALATQPVE